MIYGYVVSPMTTGVRFVIAEIIDKSRPTLELVPAPGLPPLEYCGNDYRIPPQAAQELRAQTEAAKPPSRRQMDKNRRTRLPSASWPMIAYVPFGERSVPYRDFAEVAARMRPNDWPATSTGLYMELVTIRYFKSLGSLSALATAISIIGLCISSGGSSPRGWDSGSSAALKLSFWPACRSSAASIRR